MRRLPIAALAYLVTLTPALPAEPAANEQLYRSFMENVWNKHDPAAVDRYLAPNFIEHNANLPPGREGREQFIASLLAGFSDYHGEVQEVVAEGDKVVARVLWTGTQDGPFLGRPATEGGKFAEHWDVVDSLTRAIALGLVPPPTPPAQAPPK